MAIYIYFFIKPHDSRNAVYGTVAQCGSFFSNRYFENITIKTRVFQAKRSMIEN